MSTIRLKYYFFCLISVLILSIKAQDTYNQAIVTIIGDDPVEANNTQDFVNTNLYNQPNNPPEDQKIINDNQDLVVPSLENGFHMRFEITYSKPAERLGGASFAPSSYNYEEYEKAKKRTVSLTERKFNAKKKLRKWLPKRKKKYRPTLCGRF